MKKRVFYSELAYLIGLFLIALGVVFTEKADFGVSMVVAPAYLLYRWLNPTWSFFTFGMAEYCLQAVLLLILVAILRKFRFSYLFSFVTAVLYGFILDGIMLVCQYLPVDSVAIRLVWYVLGTVISSAGVSLIYHTYVSPEVYELLVKEVSASYKLNIYRFKTCYDCTSAVVGIIMSFLIFGMWKFVGVNWGTILCAVLNGTIISACSKVYDKFFVFKDAFGFRKYFTDKAE